LSACRPGASPRRRAWSDVRIAAGTGMMRERLDRRGDTRPGTRSRNARTPAGNPWTVAPPRGGRRTTPPPPRRDTRTTNRPRPPPWAGGPAGFAGAGSMTHPGSGKYERVLERCRGMSPAPTAVAYPWEETALEGATDAAADGLIPPILVGPAPTIGALARAKG